MSAGHLKEMMAMERSLEMRRSAWISGFPWASVVALAAFGCDRSAPAVHADVTAKSTPSASTSAKASASAAPVPSDTVVETPEEPPAIADAAPEPKPKLVPFVSILPAVIPADAFLRKPVGVSSLMPPGFDRLKEKPAHTWRLADGAELRSFEFPGASDMQTFLVVVRSGVIVLTFDFVDVFSLDETHAHLAISHMRRDPAHTGKWVPADEIVELASGTTTALPSMNCTSERHFVDGGKKLVTGGWTFDAPFVPHAYVCLFDDAGKLLVYLDAGVHNHHAASIDYIRWSFGVLDADPEVIWVTREYEAYGNFDVTLFDTRPPNARKWARLATPSGPGGAPNVEFDFATTTIASSEVTFRGATWDGSWKWKWQKAKLHDAP